MGKSPSDRRYTGGSVAVIRDGELLRGRRTSSSRGSRREKSKRRASRRSYPEQGGQDAGEERAFELEPIKGRTKKRHRRFATANHCGSASAGQQLSRYTPWSDEDLNRAARGKSWEHGGRREPELSEAAQEEGTGGVLQTRTWVVNPPGATGRPYLSATPTTRKKKIR